MRLHRECGMRTEGSTRRGATPELVMPTLARLARRTTVMPVVTRTGLARQTRQNHARSRFRERVRCRTGGCAGGGGAHVHACAREHGAAAQVQCFNHACIFTRPPRRQPLHRQPRPPLHRRWQLRRETCRVVGLRAPVVQQTTARHAVHLGQRHGSPVAPQSWRPPPCRAAPPLRPLHPRHPRHRQPPRPHHSHPHHPHRRLNRWWLRSWWRLPLAHRPLARRPRWWWRTRLHPAQAWR
jgi:hypothetical protein